jgi:hypothetical protein
MRLPIKTLFLKTPPFCADRLKLITQEWTGGTGRTKFQEIKSTDRYRIRSKTFIEGSNEYDKKGGDGDSVEYG